MLIRDANQVVYLIMLYHGANQAERIGEYWVNKQSADSRGLINNSELFINPRANNIV